MCRIVHGHTACCRVLGAGGADVNVADTSGLTPLMDAAHHGQSRRPFQRPGSSCAVTVSFFRGVYDAGVTKVFPGEPDVVIGFNVDAYTCSFRPTLQYLLSSQRNTMLTFCKIIRQFFSRVFATHSIRLANLESIAGIADQPHEPEYVLELLAEPEQGFGEGARKECVQSLSKGNSFNKLVAALFEASLVPPHASTHPHTRPPATAYRASEIIAAPGRVGRGQRRDHAAVRDRNSQPGGDRGAQAFRR